MATTATMDSGTTQVRDQDGAAKLAADYHARFGFERRFGAVPGYGPVEQVVFANMGRTGSMAAAAVTFERLAPERGLTVVGRSWCSDDYTWAAVVWAEDGHTPEEVVGYLLDDYMTACGI